MIPVVIKPYLCWRAPDADVELFTDLFRFGYHEGMHKRAFGKTKDKWEKFTEDLFATQQGFIGKDKITVKALRNQWDARIEKFKTLHGWEDGRCKNLSGLEGDLSEPDATIKIMLEEIQQEKAEKEVKDADAKQTEVNEVSVIIQGYTNNSKKKRAFKQIDTVPDVDTSAVTDATPSNVLLSAVKSKGTTDFIQRLIDGVTGTTPITGTSSSTLSNDEALIMKLSKHLTDMGSVELICNAYGNCSAMPRSFDLQSCSELLDQIGLDTLARLFMENCNDPKYIKNELKDYQIDKITEGRLYSYIIHIAKSFLV